MSLILMLACVAMYYHIGRTEYKSGAQLAGISLFLWVLVHSWMGWGWLGAILAQVGLFVALTMWSARHLERRRQGESAE